MAKGSRIEGAEKDGVESGARTAVRKKDAEAGEGTGRIHLTSQGIVK